MVFIFLSKTLAITSIEMLEMPLRFLYPYVDCVYPPLCKSLNELKVKNI